MSQDQIIGHMVGRKVENLYPRPQTQAGPVLLAVKNLSVEDPANPGRYVVKDVSFEVKKGEILGIGGLMGAGRTALLSSIFGAARGRTEGHLEINGKERSLFASPQEAIAEGVALVSEDRKRFGLVLESSVRDNLVLAVLHKLVSKSMINWTSVGKTCGEQVDALRIKAPGMDALVNKLSGGNQQKVILGKWLATQPKVLLLDEPTRGIDVGAKAELYDLMGRLATQGLGIILVSSDLPEFLGLCHRMIVLNQGRMTAEFGYQDATPEKILAAAALS
jgi:D-xylose transport system ATP-binding protein